MLATPSSLCAIWLLKLAHIDLTTDFVARLTKFSVISDMWRSILYGVSQCVEWAEERLARTLHATSVIKRHHVTERHRVSEAANYYLVTFVLLLRGDKLNKNVIRERLLSFYSILLNRFKNGSINQ